MSVTLHQVHTFWQRRRLAVIFGAIYVVLSLFAMAHFFNSSYLGDRYFKTSFVGMYEGSIHQPFVYRQFIPSLSRWVTMATPDEVQYAVERGFDALNNSYEYEEFRKTLPWVARTFAAPAYPRVAAALLIYICLWGYIWALYRLSRQLFPDDLAMAYCAPVFGILAISSFSWPFQYVYDIPVLFLSTACFYCIVIRRWLAYMIFFALACWNKETSLFIFLFFIIWQFRRMGWRPYINLVIVQYVVYALVRIWLVHIYQDNEGEYLKNHLFRTLPGDLLSTSQYERVFHFSLMFFLLTYQWTKKPLFLKYGLWLLPPMYVAYLVYGMPNEFRVFFDVMPLPLLLCVHTLVIGTGLSRATLFTAHQPPPSRIKETAI